MQTLRLPGDAAWGAAATQSLYPALGVSELPDGGREKSRSSVKARVPLPCNLFPLALVEAWEPHVRAVPCCAADWLSPCLAPLYVMGTAYRLLHVSQTAFPAVPS